VISFGGWPRPLLEFLNQAKDVDNHSPDWNYQTEITRSKLMGLYPFWKDQTVLSQLIKPLVLVSLLGEPVKPEMNAFGERSWDSLQRDGWCVLEISQTDPGLVRVAPILLEWFLKEYITYSPSTDQDPLCLTIHDFLKHINTDGWQNWEYCCAKYELGILVFKSGNYGDLCRKNFCGCNLQHKSHKSLNLV